MSVYMSSCAAMTLGEINGTLIVVIDGTEIVVIDGTEIVVIDGTEMINVCLG